MHIKLIPQRRDDALAVTVTGEVLTINGEDFDFSVIPDGSSLPAGAVSSEFVIGTVERIAGVLHLTLLLPHANDATDAATHPVPIINPADGVLELPV